MARKMFTVKMTFTSPKDPSWTGFAEQEVCRSQVNRTIDHYRGWLAAHNCTELTMTVVCPENDELTTVRAEDHTGESGYAPRGRSKLFKG